MNKFLAVDTSSRYLTVLAVNGDRVALRHLDDCAMKHSVILMDEIDKALTEAELLPAECDCFCAVTGPGSFTGIRIGIACVKGFALACGKQAKGVTSFDLISYNVVSDSDYLVAIDAAHSMYYVCGYGKDGGQKIAPCYLSEAEVAKMGYPVYGFEDLPFENYTKLPVGDCLYRAAVSEKCGKAQALYVRKSQAEEERAKREKTQ